MSDSEQLKSALDELAEPARKLLVFARSTKNEHRTAIANRLALWESSFSEARNTIELLCKVVHVQSLDAQDQEALFFNQDKLDQKDYTLIYDNLAQVFCVQFHRFKTCGNAIEGKVLKGKSGTAKAAEHELSEYVRSSLEGESFGADHFDDLTRKISIFRDQLIAHDDATALFGDDDIAPDEVIDVNTVLHLGVGSFSHRQRHPNFKLDDWCDIYKITGSYLDATRLLRMFLQN